MILKSLCYSSLFLSTVYADIDDLVITEVVPSTGQVEVTNVGSEAFTSQSSLPFCHRFNYSTRIPTGTTWEAGQSLVFTAAFGNADHSDLWLYRGGSFGIGANIITGLNWGGDTGVGRARIASENGHWDGETSTTPAPPSGMALLLTGDEGTASGWTIGEPDLGNFGAPPAVEEPIEVSIIHDSGSVSLSWIGGTPPFVVESSSDLDDWVASDQQDDRTFTMPAVEERQFFRVANAGATLTAEYRITFTSTWSSETFVTVPGNDHFSPLIGATHTDAISFWEPGATATDGIRQMAETGSTGGFRSEIENAQASSTADQLVSGGGTGTSGDVTVTTFTANSSHPLFTLTTMIAPSPDWFVGIHGESLLQEDGSWVDDVTYELLAYDAGTDSGANFTSGNAATSPREPITQIAETSPFAVNDGFTSPQPVATLRIERIVEN